MTHFSFAQVDQGRADRPEELDGAVARPRAEGRLRRRHRRRRRARARRRLLPRQGARDHQRRGARQGLARRRQHRPQHHDHPLELPLRRERAALRPRARPLGRASRQDLNYNVMYSKRGVLMLAHNVHDVQVLQAPRPLEPAERRRQRLADARRRPRTSARRSTSTRTPATRSIGAALQRRGGTARHDAVAWGYARGAAARGVDIIQNCAVTGDPPRRRRPRHRRRDHARLHRARRRSASSAAGHTSVVMETGRRPPAARKLSAAGAGLRAGQAGLPLRRDVELGARLHLASPTRASSSSAPAPTSMSPTPSAAACTSDRAHARRDLRDVPDLPPHADAAQMGRHRRRDARPLADPRQDAGPRPLRQLRLGHRRLQGDAGLRPRLRPHRRHATSRTRSTRPSRSSASPPAG